MEKSWYLEHTYCELHKLIGNEGTRVCCKDTHIINELQNPIYVDDLKDIVVAVYPNGILFCSGEHLEQIKESVENFIPYLMYEERCWDTYYVLDDSTYAYGSHSPL